MGRGIVARAPSSQFAPHPLRGPIMSSGAGATTDLYVAQAACGAAAFAWSAERLGLHVSSHFFAFRGLRVQCNMWEAMTSPRRRAGATNRRTLKWLR